MSFLFFFCEALDYMLFLKMWFFVFCFLTIYSWLWTSFISGGPLPRFDTQHQQAVVQPAAQAHPAPALRVLTYLMASGNGSCW